MSKLVSLVFLVSVILQLTIAEGMAKPTQAWSADTYAIWALKSDAPDQSIAVSFSDWCVFFPNAASETPGVRYILNQIAANGIRTVWWRTFGGGWAQYGSRVKDVTHGYYPGFGKSYGEFDPLAEAVPQAHKLGLKIYAWYTPMEEAHAWPYNVRSNFVDKYPELTDRTPKRDAGAPSFFYEKYRKYKVDLGLEMVQRYKTDGLVIDLERRGAPGRNNTWGYLPQIIEGYKKETGIDPLTLPSNDPDWSAYRAQYFGMFIKELHDGIKKLNRPVELVVMVREKQPLSANWNVPEWIKQGWIDRVVIGSWGKEGWGSMTDGKTPLAEYRTNNIPIGIQCYTYRPKAEELMKRAEFCKDNYDELAWFESTPTMHHKSYHIPRRIACPDTVRIYSPEFDMTKGGQVAVLAAGTWKLWIKDENKPDATGTANKTSVIKLPPLSGKNRIHVECTLKDDEQKSGIIVQGWSDSEQGHTVITSDSSWKSSDDKAPKVVKVAHAGIPPFLGADLSLADISNKSDLKYESYSENVAVKAPGTYSAFPIPWQGKWIWGPTRKDTPTFDINVYDWIVKFPGGWGQTLVNRLVGKAANAGLDKIYWHLENDKGELLFPNDNEDNVVSLPSWGVDFGKVDMPKLALSLSRECGIDCSLVVSEKWRDAAVSRYPSAKIVIPEDINSAKIISVMQYPKGNALAQKWLLRKTYYFRKEIDIPYPVDSMELCITAEQSYECYFDGKFVGANADWWQAETYKIPLLAPGKHVIAVKVEPGKQLSGLLINTRWKDSKGKSVNLNSDESWKVSSEKSDGWKEVGFDDVKWSDSSIVGIEGIGSRFRLKEPWHNIRKPGRKNSIASMVKISVKVNKPDAMNMVDGVYDDSSYWRNKKIPEEVIFEFAEPIKNLNGITIYSGKLVYYGNPSGVCDLKSFALDTFEDGKWQPLCDVVSDIPPYNDELPEKARFKKMFKPRTVSKVRLTILDSHDTMRRVGASTKKCISKPNKGCFIREIEFSISE